MLLSTFECTFITGTRTVSLVLSVFLSQTATESSQVKSSIFVSLFLQYRLHQSSFTVWIKT